MAVSASFSVTFAVCVLLCTASPTRRQFVSIRTETTSSDPAAVSVANEWDDTDDFVLDGEDDWLNEAAVSPSSIPLQSEYEDYDDDDDDEFTDRRSDKVVAEDQDDDELDHQDAEEEEEDTVHNGNQHDAEFLFLPSRDNRLMLQDDDDPSGPIKVRHTGKNPFPDDLDISTSKEQKISEDSNQQQFEFTIDEDDGDISDKDDFVLQDVRDNAVDNPPRRRELPDEDDEDDDEDFVAGEDAEEDSVFENPEEDSQVIYGDHVFLY